MGIIDLIVAEERRQQETITLIPSENYASRAVREAVGSVLSNKYAEGYPGKRYYQGNKIIDEIEQLAINRVKNLFGAKFANVQAYSGSPANAAILMALAAPGEKIMGMKLAAGGHLTHGHPKITFSGRYYESVQYDVDETGRIDHDEVEKLAIAERPKVIFVGTTAYPFKFDFKIFREIADKTGAYLVADISHIAGLVAGGEHESPIDVADVVMSTTHKTLRGPRGAIIMTNNEELAGKIDKAVFPGMQGGPHMNSIAGIAVAMEEASRPEFKVYIRQVVKNAKVLAEELGVKTENHLMVMNVGNGREVSVKLEEVGIIVNANTVPHDPNPPMNPSGIRLGTPAVTTRGMKEAEMKQIAKAIKQVIAGQSVTVDIRAICREFGMD